MSNTERPLSPHFSIYRWPVTMLLSILHRVTGVALSVGFVVLVAWLFSAALSADSYASFHAAASSTLGRLLLIGWSYAFFFHLSNGVRHLWWDTGRGLEKSQATLSAWVVLVKSIVFTAIFWWVAL